MRRAWFQLHLSTCIVLMFAAGGLLWLNARAFTHKHLRGEWMYIQLPYKNDVTISEYGWPRKCCTYSIYNDSNLPPRMYWYTSELVTNFLVAGGILFVVALGVEWLTRRRPKNSP